MFTKETIKRHIYSAIVTFIATFALVFTAGVLDVNFVFNEVSVTALAGGALVAAVRAVAKIIREGALVLIAKSKK